MMLVTREVSFRRVTATTPAWAPPNQRHGDTVGASSEADPQAQLLAMLAANARRLTGTTGAARQAQRLNRAQLWEQLAEIVALPCAQAYRNAASVCRQEADTLNTSARSDLMRVGEKAA